MVAYLDQAGVQHLIAKIRNTFWPVGTILATTSTASPASYLGGSWEAYAPGRTLVGVSTTDTDFTLNKQGGAKTVNVGRSTDLATGAKFNDHAGVNVAWQDTSAHEPVKIAFGFELETKGGVNWNTKTTTTGTKVYGNLPLMNPYVAVHYWRRVA
jgi:hypothetical protein